MRWVYYVVVGRFNGLANHWDFVPMELKHTKKLTTLEDVEKLLLIANNLIHEDLMARADKEYPLLSEAARKLPRQAVESCIVSFSLLRKEEAV
jgi:hypothetical protein